MLAYNIVLQLTEQWVGPNEGLIQMLCKAQYATGLRTLLQSISNVLE